MWFTSFQLFPNQLFLIFFLQSSIVVSSATISLTYEILKNNSLLEAFSNNDNRSGNHTGMSFISALQKNTLC